MIKNSLKTRFKGSRGITLIALVVSVIVLLILAGVSISAITGNESAMEKAKQARTANEQGGELDAIKLAVVEAVAKGTNGYVTLSDLNNALNDAGFNDATEGIDENEGKFVVTGVKGREYIVEKNGQVTANDPQPVTEITLKKSENIQVQQGKTVKLRNAINTTPASNIEALTYTKLSGDDKITVNPSTGVVSATADAEVGKTATIKMAGSISTNVSLTVTVEVIEPVKPHYDEAIILGEAIEGVNGDTNEDDWKILCYDEDKQKIYAILDSYLPTSKFPAGSKLSTDGDYGFCGEAYGNKAITRDEFIEELTDTGNWRNLVSNSNTSIEVYGALPKGNSSTEKTMNYAKSKRENTYFVPLNASSLNGYWLASPYVSEGYEKVVYYVKNGGSLDWCSFGAITVGLCPVAIIPASIVEQNENGIWEAK